MTDSPRWALAGRNSLTTVFREVGDDDVQAHRLDAGRWKDETFPREGWRFSMIKDMGDVATLCAMCQHARVRYAHVLVHPTLPGGILVGLQCAEALQEDDHFGPEKREREYRTDLRIKNDWPKRPWKTSRIGNLYLNSRGFNISIWRKGPGFGITIRLENKFGEEFVRNDPRMYTTIEDAKLGALDRLLEARVEFRAQT